MKTHMSDDAHTGRVSEKGWVVIPKELRNKYGLVKGTAVRFVDYDGVIGIVPVGRDPISQSRGMFRGSRLTESLLEERKRDREIEDREWQD
ncbi:MAG: AbrB/MazE/SpoVT family DNA-binding domain-containing protein [Ignavibacteriales bacterium]